jgi:hypothetical protein
MFRLWYKGLELIAGDIDLLLDLLDENDAWFATLGENFTLEAPDRVRTYSKLSSITCKRILVHLRQQHRLERGDAERQRTGVAGDVIPGQ